MNRDSTAHLSVLLSWMFTSINPAMVTQVMSALCSVFAIANYIYSIREKRKSKP